MTAQKYRLNSGLLATGTGPSRKIVKAGGIFESEQDMLKHNVPGNPNKFDKVVFREGYATEKAEEPVTEVYDREELDAYELEDLVALAAEKGVTLIDATSAETTVAQLVGVAK